MICIPLFVALVVGAAAQQRTLFNVTLSQNPGGPPEYFVAAVRGVAAVANMQAEGGSQPAQGLLTSVSNTTGKVLWVSNMSASSGFGEGLVSLLDGFVLLDANGRLSQLDALTGATKWSSPFLTSAGDQAFAASEAHDLVAWTDSDGTVALFRGSTGAMLWTVVLDVPKWTDESSLFISLSAQYVVVVHSSMMFVLSVASTSKTALYTRNVSSMCSFVSPRHAISGDTLVFSSQTTVSTMELSSGTIRTIGALNTTQYWYTEVVITSDNSAIYIVTVDGSFKSPQGEQRRRVGNNYPMFVTKNDILSGAALWEWSTDDTVSNLGLVGNSFLTFVTTGGPVALRSRDGTVASSVSGGLDYSEPAPPLLYEGSVWYFATEYYWTTPATIKFVGVIDSSL